MKSLCFCESLEKFTVSHVFIILLNIYASAPHAIIQSRMLTFCRVFFARRPRPDSAGTESGATAEVDAEWFAGADFERFGQVVFAWSSGAQRRNASGSAPRSQSGAQERSL